MTNNKITRFKFLLPLAAFHNMLWVLGIFTNATVVHMGKFEVSASTFLVIMFFATNDVITEVYGYHVMKKLIWSTIFSLFIMMLLLLIILSIPGVTTWPDTQYREILSQSAFVTGIGIAASLISSFMNSYLLSRWKILLKGRHYFGRSITTTAISALFFTIIAYTYRLIHLPIEQSMNFIMSAYVIKLIADVILAFPSTVLQYCLKKLEHTDTFDVDIKFNPFNLRNNEKQGDAPY